MKKIVLWILMLFASKALHALPIGNPQEPNFLVRHVLVPKNCPNIDPCGVLFKFGLKAGFYGDYVYDRKLKVGNATKDHLHETQMFTNAAYFALNIGDRLDIFGTVGSTHFCIAQREESWNTTLPASRQSIGVLSTNSDFSWSAGARGTLFKICGFSLGAEGQYFQTKPKFTRFYSFFGTGNRVFLSDRVRYKEWQGGVALSYAITCRDPLWMIVPYAGVKWAWARLDGRDFEFTIDDPVLEEARTLTIFNLKEQIHAGYSLGISLVAWGNTAFTLEGRWVNEKALYFNTQFRF